MLNFFLKVMMNLYNLLCVLTTLGSTRITASPIVFPVDDPSSDMDFPLDLALRINNITDIDELMNFMDESSRPNDILEARIGGHSDKNKFRLAKRSSCTPKLTTVCLKPPNVDSASHYHPQCTDVQRCSGCCAHDLLSCQPTEKEILELGVIIFEFKPGKPLFYRGRDVVSIEQHKSCKCDCRVKASDCGKNQIYNKDQCRCVCANYDDQEKCYKAGILKLWNPNECTCECRKIFDCSSGYHFDAINTCQCVPDRNNTWNG